MASPVKLDSVVNKDIDCCDCCVVCDTSGSLAEEGNDCNGGSDDCAGWELKNDASSPPPPDKGCEDSILEGALKGWVVEGGPAILAAGPEEGGGGRDCEVTNENGLLEGDSGAPKY